MSSWKQYGGVKNLDTNRKITTNTVITDEIILKNAYVGGFTINGVLDVTGRAIIQSELDVSGIIKSWDISTNTLQVKNNTKLYGPTFIGEDLTVAKNIYTGNSISVANNIYIGNNAEIINYLYFNKSKSYFIFGNDTGIGINTINAKATLDICTNIINGLNIFSSQSKNKNIIARNNLNKGISVTSDISFSSIDFFINNSNIDSSIIYKNNGILELDISNTTQLMSTLSVTNKGNPEHINNETVIIYDICSGIYKPEIYNNSTSNYGNALTLVTDNSNSSTFLNIITPDKSGLGIAGGCYPYDNSRNMGIFGLFDNSGNYTQSQTIISGKDPVKYKTTTGINTYIPNSENYILDINGPVHIDNGDITIVNIADFQIIKLAVSPSGDLVMAAGYPTNTLYPDYGYSRILISRDYGKTWIQQIFQNKSDSHSYPFQSTSVTINDIYIYDNSYAFIVASDSENNPILVYSDDSGIYWNTTVGFTDDYKYNFSKIKIIDQIITDNENNITVNLYISNNYDSNEVKFYNINLLLSGSNSDTYTVTESFNFSNNINSFDYYYNNQQFYFTTSFGIYSLTDEFILLHNSTTLYNSIICIKNNIIAVGNNIISVSTDGTNFIDTIFNNTNFTSLFSYKNFVFTIGNNNIVFISNDYGITWNPLWTPNNLGNISQSGKQYLITDPNNNYSNIILSDPDTILLSNTIIPYSNNNISQSSIINCFLPNLCNRINNHILDISGNMRISGDIHVNDNGSIISNNSEFFLINETVNSVNFAGNASSIIIGNTVTGNTVIRNNLNVGLNTTIYGNTNIYGIETVLNKTDSSGVNSGALIVNGGASFSKNIYIGNDTNISGNSNISGNANIVKNVNINGNLNIKNNIHTMGNLYVSNGIFSQNNINSYGIIYANSNISSQSIGTGALIVNGGASISDNLNISGNTNIGRNLFTYGSITGNTVITNSIYSNSDLNIGYIDYYTTGNINIGYNSDIITIGGIKNEFNIEVDGLPQTIYLGNPKTNTYKSEIFIGGINDIVNIQGSEIKVGGKSIFSSTDNEYTEFQQYVQYSKDVYLNMDQCGNQVGLLNPSASGKYATSYGSGLWIRDFSVNNLGLFIITADVQGFIFKAPTYGNIYQYQSELLSVEGLKSQNIIRLDVNKMTTTAITGLVTLSPISNDPDGCRYSITGSNIDITNIFIKDKDISQNIQSISTDINIKGNIYSKNNAVFNNLLINTNIAVPNTVMTISGNTIINRLGIGTSSVNPDANSLEVQGNIYQQNGGYIWQF
jgi:hypothetical protein